MEIRNSFLAMGLKMANIQLPPMLDVEKRRLYDKARDFLVGKKADHTGMFVNEYFDKNDNWLESCHGWIQWAFPIDTISQYNDKCGNYFRDNQYLMREYNQSGQLSGNREKLTSLYLATIGINLHTGTDVNKFFRVVDSPYNHHMKRISRLLTHLMLTGATYDARTLYRVLINDIVSLRPNNFLPLTIAYWSSIVLEFDDTTREKL